MAFVQTTKRKKGIVYIIRYRLNGKPFTHNLPFGISRKEANALCSEFNSRIAKHKAGIESFTNPLKPHRSQMTIHDFRDWFFENKKTAIRKGKAVADLTMKMYDRSFRFLMNWIGNIHVSEIPKHVSEIEEQLNPYEPSTRSAYIRSLRAAWEFGIKNGKLKDNPFRNIEITKQRKLPDILTVDEKEKISKNIMHPQVKLAFALARYAGLRREEICRNIRWEDVWWEENILNIPRAKTGENQKVPILTNLKNILQEQKKDKGFIVELHPHTVTHYLTGAKIKAGINKKGSIHILRHSLGSDLISQGLSTRSIQELLRHSQITTTEIYTQLSKKALQEQLKGKIV